MALIAGVRLAASAGLAGGCTQKRLTEATADPAADWVRRFFDAVDLMDVELLASRFTRSAHLRFGHSVDTIGKSAIRQVLIQAANQFDFVHHEAIEIWSKGSVAIFESDVTLVRSGAGAITLPVTHVLRREGNLVSHWYISTYIDLATECWITSLFSISQTCGCLSA